MGIRMMSRALASIGVDITRARARQRSLWLDQALPGTLPAAPLDEATTADVCIVGGGFVGLWTAYWIKRWRPECDVVVLEQDLCGGGASGRNGGFVLSWWAKFPSLETAVGTRVATEICYESQTAIDEIAAFCDHHGVDAHLVRGGWLWTARTAAGMNAWNTTVERCRRVNPDAFISLTPDDIARRTGSSAHIGGVLDPSAATVHPAHLVRGLRDVCLSLGTRLYENSHVRRFTRDRPVVVHTDRGSVTADVVVLATNAWAAGVPELRRHIVAISSDIVATPPIAEELSRIGWTGGEAITDSQQMVDYYRTTRDGRIVFGKGGWGIALGGRIPRSFDRNETRSRAVEADLRDAYPRLAHVAIDSHWSGPIDRSADGLPILGHLGGREHILHGVGWSGNGVGPAVVGSKSLARRALGLADESAVAALWNRRAGTFPPDPIRYVGAHLVREAVRRKELAERADRNPSSLAIKISRLVPAGLEDH